MNISIKKISMFNFFNNTIVIIIAFICIYPFIYMLALSFNEGMDTMRGGITFYPRKFTVANYTSIIRDGMILNAYKITIARTLIGTLLGVIITGLVAYGLSERSLPGRQYIMFYLLIPMFFSGGLIPFYLTMSKYGLIDNFWIFVLPYIFNIWNCIVMKTFFTGISSSLKESIRIDGGNEFQIFYHIIIPIARPMFAAISLFIAVTHWNEWFLGAYFVNKTELLPMQTYLQIVMNRDMSQFLERDLRVFGMTGVLGLFDYSKTTSFSLKVSAVILGLTPILILYPFLQKYFVKGVMIGSLKE